MLDKVVRVEKPPIPPGGVGSPARDTRITGKRFFRAISVETELRGTDNWSVLTRCTQPSGRAMLFAK
jgi:hypothetical protein